MLLEATLAVPCAFEKWRTRLEQAEVVEEADDSMGSRGRRRQQQERLGVRLLEQMWWWREADPMNLLGSRRLVELKSV